MKVLLSILSVIKKIFQGITSSKQRERYENLDKELTVRKKEIGEKIRKISLALNVGAKDLVEEGNHPTVKGSIEKGEKNYTIDTLLKYLISIENISNRKSQKSGRYFVDLFIGVMNGNVFNEKD